MVTVSRFMMKSLSDVDPIRHRSLTSFPEKGCFTPRAHLVVVVVSDLTLAYLLTKIQDTKLHIDPAIPSVRLLRDQFALVPVQVLPCILVEDVSSFLILSVFVRSSTCCALSVLVCNMIHISG